MVKPNCAAPKCERAAEIHGLCQMHAARMKRIGSLDLPVRLTHTCTVEGCLSTVLARGMCNKHYTRWRVNGSTSTLGWRNSAHTRWVLSQLPTDDCVSWPGTKGPVGYGSMQRRGHRRMAHRVFYEMLVEPIPEGLALDHVCHNKSDCNLGTDCPHRSCVNPAHLEPVTYKENDDRARARPQHPHYRPDRPVVDDDFKRLVRSLSVGGSSVLAISHNVGISRSVINKILRDPQQAKR